MSAPTVRVVWAVWDEVWRVRLSHSLEFAAAIDHARELAAEQPEVVGRFQVARELVVNGAEAV